jgi:hypothetical protein
MKNMYGGRENPLASFRRTGNPETVDTFWRIENSDSNDVVSWEVIAVRESFFPMTLNVSTLGYPYFKALRDDTSN